MGIRSAAGALALALVVVACSGEAPVAEGNQQRVAISDSTTSTTAVASTTTSVATSESTTDTTPTATSTFDDPVAPGETVRVADWELTVLSANPDATEVVLAENQFNDPPRDGSQFFMVQVAATYTGDGSQTTFSGLGIDAMAADRVIYDFESGCGVIPDPLRTFAAVFPGGTVTGNLCWEVAADDVDSLVLVAEPGFSFGEVLHYLAIPDDGVRFEVPPARSVPIEAGPLGTRGNPIPVGTAVLVGNWEISVTSSTPDATEAVLAYNSFNEAPPQDRQFLLVEVMARYVGEGVESLGSAVSLTSVGQTSVEYISDDSCGVVPEALTLFDDTESGVTLAGTVCWSVRRDDVVSLVLMADPALDTTADPIFFAIP